MRFFFDRLGTKNASTSTSRYTAKLSVNEQNDRRGRHTSSDLRAKRAAARNTFETIYYPVRSCSCDRFTVPVDYSQGAIVCTGCGVVMDDHLLCPVVSRTAESNTGRVGSALDRPQEWCFNVPQLSAGYRRENHLAEVLKQATAMDPRIPDHDLDAIYKCFQEYLAKKTYSERMDILYNIDFLTNKDIKAIIQPMGAYKVKKYAERWLQIRRHLYWRENDEDEPRSRLLTFTDCIKVHEKYAVFVKAFEALQKEGHLVFLNRHNIPYLNTCITHILHQIHPELARQQKWYFTDLETIQSRLITEHRCALMLRYLRKHPEITGDRDNTQWQYKCLLPKDDITLFNTNRKKFVSILKSQIRICHLQAKKRRASSRSTTQENSRQQQSQSTLTVDEQSWISSLGL